MATTLSSIITMVRYIINDVAKTIKQVELYDSTATRPTVFTLDEDNPISVTAIYKNGAAQDDSTWAYDSTTGEVTCSFSLSNNDTVQINYTAYERYSDTELQNYIRHAVYQLGVNGYFTYKIVSTSIYPDMSEEEEQLVAIVTGILIKPENKSYRLPNLEVRVANTAKLTYQIVAEVIAKFKKCKSGTIEIL